MAGGGATDGDPATGPDGKAAPEPSSGCGSADPPSGSSQSPLSIAGHQYYVRLPNGYDENQPYPLVFVFNPTGNPISWAESSSGWEQTEARDNAILVYPAPANMGSGWGAGDVDLFDPLYEQMVDNYCVDQARVFSTGESSGGDYTSILGCEFADKLRAIGPTATKPVGAYPLDVSQRNCTAQVAATVIHGLNDNVVGPENGPATRDFYLELANCGTETTPVEGYTDELSNCVKYEGCDEGFPVIWCGHKDPEYSGTNHGYPKFAAKMLWEQFSSY